MNCPARGTPREVDLGDEPNVVVNDPTTSGAHQHARNPSHRGARAMKEKHRTPIIVVNSAPSSGREQAIPDEESAGVTGGESGGVSALLLRSRLQSPPPVMPALDPSGNTSSRPSDNASSHLSRNYCGLPSGRTSAHPLRPRLPSPPPVTPARE